MTTPTTSPLENAVSEEAGRLGQRLIVGTPEGYVAVQGVHLLADKVSRGERLDGAEQARFQTSLSVLRTIWNLYKAFRPVEDPEDPYWAASETYTAQFARLSAAPLKAKTLSLDRDQLVDMIGLHRDGALTAEAVLGDVANLVALHHYRLDLARKCAVDYSPALERASAIYARTMDQLLDGAALPKRQPELAASGA